MNKHLILIYTLLFFCSLSSAQQFNNDVPPKTKKQFSVGFSCSIDYCNRWLRDVDKSYFSETSIQLKNEREIGKPGYTIGASVEMPLSKQSVLTTGLLFANKGYQTKWDRNEQLPDTAQIKFADLKSIYTTYHFDIPLVFQTYLSPSDKKWFLSFGLTTNIFLKQTFTLVSEKNNHRERDKIEDTYNFRKFNLSPEIGFGKEINLNTTTNLQIAPVFRCGIFSTRDAPVAIHLWSLGLRMVCIGRKQS